MFERSSEASRQVIFFALIEACRVGAKVVDTEHLLLGLVRVDLQTFGMTASPVFEDRVRARSALWHTSTEALPTSTELPLSHDAQRALEDANSLSLTHGCDYVRTEHLLFALLNGDGTHAAIKLEEGGVSADALTKVVTGIPRAGQQRGVVFSPDNTSMPPES